MDEPLVTLSTSPKVVQIREQRHREGKVPQVTQQGGGWTRAKTEGWFSTTAFTQSARCYAPSHSALLPPIQNELPLLGAFSCFSSQSFLSGKGLAHKEGAAGGGGMQEVTPAAMNLLYQADFWVMSPHHV